MFTVHNVSKWPNLRHLGKPLGGGGKDLLKAVSFKKATETIGTGRFANARWERGCNCNTNPTRQR